MTRQFYEATIILHPETNLQDETLYFTVQLGETLCSFGFPLATTLSQLLDWLNNPLTIKETRYHMQTVLAHSRKVAYDHETGQLRLYSTNQEGGHPATFDPSSDESLAKFVRRLKAFAPIPKSEGQPLPMELPTPTPAQLANAQRYTSVASAKGAGGRYSKPKAKSATPSLSAEASLAIIQGILAEGLTLPQAKPKRP